MSTESQQTKTRKEARITYRKEEIDPDKSVKFISVPWSYLITGVAFFLIGILDLYLLGSHIGHPPVPDIGIYVGQGAAIFLGGTSFFYTVGLFPLVAGLGIIIYCIFATKRVILGNTKTDFVVQVWKPLFPSVTHIDKGIVRKKYFTNTGLQARHLWIILFIPMGIRILQFGIPLFGEHMAQDEILPIMMVFTGAIEILGAFLMLIIPSQTLKYESDEKEYIINFFSNKSSRIQNLMVPNPLTRKSSIDLVKLIPGIVLILASLMGLSIEYLWGMDLSMVGITYGILFILRIIQNEAPQYFSASEGASEDTIKLRKLSLFDILGIGLLLYLSTIEFLWGWFYITDTHALIIVDLVITSILWIGLLFWVFVYVFIPPTSKVNFKGIKAYWESGKKNRLNIILRILFVVASLGLTLIKLI